MDVQFLNSVGGNTIKDVTLLTWVDGPVVTMSVSFVGPQLRRHGVTSVTLRLRGDGTMTAWVEVVLADAKAVCSEAVTCGSPDDERTLVAHLLTLVDALHERGLTYTVAVVIGAALEVIVHRVHAELMDTLRQARAAGDHHSTPQ